MRADLQRGPTARARLLHEGIRAACTRETAVLEHSPTAPTQDAETREPAARRRETREPRYDLTLANAEAAAT